MELIIKLTEDEEKEYEEFLASLLSTDIFVRDCCGRWLCGLYFDKKKNCWLVGFEEDLDGRDRELMEEQAIAKYNRGEDLPDYCCVWDREKAVVAMNYGIREYGLTNWLDGISSDANAIDDAIQMAIFDEIIYC